MPYGLSRVQSLTRTHVTRGKMSASSAGLRYVLLPSVRAPPVTALATAGRELVYRLVLRNRERELGLDRRETG
jgi:hypothetical protein